MILRNHTPFRPLYFESRDVQGHDFGVVVLRGTFDILPGQPLRPCPRQDPIVEADAWHGEPNASSVSVESDLAPFKPRTDILINAVAHAPGGRPLPDWMVRVKVGELEKALRVTGPRRWVREDGGWRLTEPEEVAAVPMRYENAFGGAWETGWREKKVFDQNPVGLGFVGEESPSYPDEIGAPQIEAPDAPVTELGKEYPPEGLGPIARSWQPRLGLAGTFDEAWRRTRWPALPENFQFAHHNAAHPGLQYPGFVRGDEEVRLEGLSPDGSLLSYLPGYRVGLLLRFEDGSMAVAPALLDTVTLDVPEGRGHLTWRAVFPKVKAIRVIEPRMTQPNEGSHG
jgi:hypothetical protein